jgi:hypothetical protein
MFLLKSKPQTFASLALASQAKYLFSYVNQPAKGNDAGGGASLALASNICSC